MKTVFIAIAIVYGIFFAMKLWQWKIQRDIRILEQELLTLNSIPSTGSKKVDNYLDETMGRK